VKRIIAVQARMTSSRLPGKVLLDVAGRPMLAQQLRRLKQCREAEDIVIATTVNPADDPLAELARKEGVGVVRGSESDVLERFLRLTRETKADVVVRITADCPLICPDETDRVITALTGELDYAANVLQRTYPRGLDTEAMHADVVERMNRLAHSEFAREHVTTFIRLEQPQLFRCCSVVDESGNNSDLRWTVDVPEDLRLVRALYQALNLGTQFVGYRDILAYVRAHPELSQLNAHVAQKLT